MMHSPIDYYGLGVYPEVVIDPHEPTFLFVYGSLKEGYKYHNLLGRNPKFLGNVETEPNFLLYDTGPYPGMVVVNDGEGRAIEGELYQISPEQMMRLDKAVPYQFKKKEIKLKGINHKVICHIWHYGVDKFLDCGTSWPRT